MQINIQDQACTGCNYCTISCSVGAIRLDIGERARPVIDTSSCTGCGACITNCPNNVFSSEAFSVEPVALADQYDAIIIGAGIGGLMTAAGLARAGKRVLIVEQLSFVGGKYTHLVHKGYAISTAAWTCPGPNSRIGKLARKLGAQIDWITIHQTGAKGGQQGNHWVVTRDGRRFISLDQAQECLVGGPAEMPKVHRWVADMYNPFRTYPDQMTTREYIQRFVPGNEEYTRYVQTIITYCFASQTVDTFPAMETKRAIVDSIEQMADWGTAQGGTQAIVAALEKVVRDSGGEIALCTRASRILLDNGRATGVCLADGREVRAGVVIHNGGLNRLITLTGEENLPPAYLARLKSCVPALVAALVLGTRLPLLGPHHSLLHSMGWEPTLNCYAPTYFDPGLAPAGRHMLDVFWVMEAPYSLEAELERVLRQLREIFPDFDDQVEMMIPMFFTGAWTAEMAHRSGQSGKDRLDPQTPIENLYLVGYDAIGYGMAGDIIPHGVERALHLILKDDRYAPEDEKGSTRLKFWLKSAALQGVAALSGLKRSNHRQPG